MNKRKPQNYIEVCMCLLLWEIVWLAFSCYQGIGFSHWEHCMNYVMLWAGGWSEVPASLGYSVVILRSEPGNLLYLSPLAPLLGLHFCSCLPWWQQPVPETLCNEIWRWSFNWQTPFPVYFQSICCLHILTCVSCKGLLDTLQSRGKQ